MKKIPSLHSFNYIFQVIGFCKKPRIILVSLYDGDAGYIEDFTDVEWKNIIEHNPEYVKVKKIGYVLIVNSLKKRDEQADAIRELAKEMNRRQFQC